MVLFLLLLFTTITIGFRLYKPDYKWTAGFFAILTYECIYNLFYK